MIAGIGIDIVDIARVEALLQRHGMRFLQRICTPGEIETCLGRHDVAACIAGRFAAKEAAFKALSAGRSSGIAFKEILVSAAGANPQLHFTGKAHSRAGQLGISRSHLSISHDRGCAVAVVILESA